MSGYKLMEEASAGRPDRPGQDERTSARDLLLARVAGRLGRFDPSSPGVRPLDPIVEAQQWLQQDPRHPSEPRVMTVPAGW